MSHGRTGALLREQEGSSLPEAEDREGQGRARQGWVGLGWIRLRGVALLFCLMGC